MSTENIFYTAAMRYFETMSGAAPDSDCLAMCEASDADILAWADDLEARLGWDVSDFRAAVTAYCVDRSGDWEDAQTRVACVFECLSGEEAGDVAHATYSEGATASLYRDNTGGGVWVSLSLHGRVYVSAGCNGFDCYTVPDGLTFEDAVTAHDEACGDVPAGWVQGASA